MMEFESQHRRFRLEPIQCRDGQIYLTCFIYQAEFSSGMWKKLFEIPFEECLERMLGKETYNAETK